MIHLDHLASVSASLDVSRMLGWGPPPRGVFFKYKEAQSESAHPATYLIGLTLGATVHLP